MKQLNKTIKKTLAITAMVIIFLAGTLWLCLNVSWWFATIYAVPLVFAAVLITLVWLQIEGTGSDRHHNP